MNKKNVKMTKIKPKTPKYSKVFGFDIETHGKKNDFVLACFYSSDGNRYYFRKKDDVAKFLNSEYMRNAKVYATNLPFDFLGTFWEYSNHWELIERKGHIYQFTWYQKPLNKHSKNGNPCIKFYDTFNIAPFSVEKIGDILGLPKLKHPSCFGQLPINKMEWDELTKYCMQDARVTYDFVIQILFPMLEKYGIPIKTTIGSIAVQDFRTNFLKETIFQEPEINRKIAFKSYFGGRTEVFKRGYFKNVYCFDINSLYPSVMVNEMPNPNKHQYFKQGSEYKINNYEGVTKVKVYVPENIHIPPLPYRKDNKLIFPTGIFYGHYNHNELRNAMKYGVQILKCYESIIYTETKKYFKTFVQHHYKERLKLKYKKSPLEIMEKLILNSLYGKFSFNYKSSSSLVPAKKFDENFPKYNENSKSMIPVPSIENPKFISVEEETEPPVYSFPIWSSYITSYARIKMYEYLVDNRLKHKLIYTDTDSIFIHDYKKEIKQTTELGGMKLEDGYPIPESIFIRPKLYYTEKPKGKGMKFKPFEFGDKLYEPDFYELLKGKHVPQQRFTKLRTALKDNNEFEINEIQLIWKKNDLDDTKRVWENNFIKLYANNPQFNQFSKPLYINEDNEIRQKEKEQSAKNKEYHDKMFYSNKDFIEDDNYDKNSVSDDITYNEDIENKKHFGSLGI